MATTLLSTRSYFPPISVAIIVFLFISSMSIGHAQDAKKLTESEFALCKSKIERAHQGFYKLSFSQDYVRDVIMPSVRNERATIAPHFPARQSGVKSDDLFKSWIETYPAEYESYLVFLRKQHEKWRIASSSANH